MRKIKPVEQMAIFDDFMFSAALDGRNEAVAEILQVVLHDPRLTVQAAKTQYYVGNLGKGSLLLDVLAVDGRGRHLNIEFQRDSRGAGADRACYHYAALATHLAREMGASALPAIGIVVFTERDYWGYGQAIYEIENTLKIEPDRRRKRHRTAYVEVPDKLHIRYVNCRAKRDLRTKAGRLIHDLFCPDPGEMFFPGLAEALRDCKGSGERRRRVDHLIEAFKMMGRDEAREEEREEVALNLLAYGDSVEKVAKCAMLPLDQVLGLKKKASVRAARP